MTATILDGRATLAAIKEELRVRVKALTDAGRTPGLGTVLVGDDPGSQAYVAGKHRDCADVGIVSIRRDLPATATQAEVEAVVAELNADPTCTGYLVQLPLPEWARRAARARAGGFRQGRRRTASDESRSPRARRVGSDPGHPAVHAAGHRRTAAPLRRTTGRSRCRRDRARYDRRPGLGPAAHPPDRERDRDHLPYRHPRHRRLHADRRHRGGRGRRAGHAHPRHGQAGGGRSRRRDHPRRWPTTASRSSSATCIPTSPRWPGSWPRFPAALAR